jgi:hypothetical protein
MSLETVDEIRQIETTFSCQLPSDYETFLRTGPQFEAGESFEFPLPLGCIHGPVGTIDHLYSAGEILENDARGASWDEQARMLIIGYDVCGGYVYLSLSEERAGVFFRAPYVSGEYFCAGATFGDFLSALKSVPDE